MQARFIKRLPLHEKESFLNVRVRQCDASDAHNWKRLIQPHVGPARPDAKWNWPWLFWQAGKSEALFKRVPSLFCIEIAGSGGKAVPLAMMMLSEGYPALDGGYTPCVYIWYAAAAPGAALKALGAPPDKLSMILEALLDTAIQRSYELGYDGRVGLHADPSGGEQLFSKYRDKARMTPLLGNASLTVARKMKRNDGRYFWTDPKLAQSLSNSLDFLR
ncbi:hypothetical protein [Duganella radicis]|uniref:GNAT family N-acetyltransferase n=1 Tax=Duganella radicis TaxID=551988 RepID=A0A6L6PRN4_9BURK|nr:hypothetical protein [Duganella radicis]MTV41301.1 hypothetical protein [Duganella radicis]